MTGARRGRTGHSRDVTKASAKILADALALSEQERLDLASELLASVDGPPDPGWEQAWQEELDRRTREADASAEPAAEWSEVRARVLAKLTAK